jgi:SAM-dependent methyltransferase
MFDYEGRYRRLRELGLEGWRGADDGRGLARLAEVLDWLAPPHLPSPPARVLELGCGNGYSASLLMARKGFEVSGVDISRTAIAWAQELFIAEGVRGTFLVGDVGGMMPFFGENAFDVVIDGSCLHCLIGDQRSRCLAEVRRILRHAGLFIVSSMCGAPRSDEAKARFDHEAKQLLQDGVPYRTLKPLEELEDEVTGAGFAVQERRLSVNSWWDHVTLVCTPSV